MKLIDGIPVWGDPVDEGALEQIKRCAKTADYVALMADHHKGYSVPIGGVVAYRDKISPSGVGFDIGCGNKAVLTDLHGTDLAPEISPIMDTIWSRISFGIGQKNNVKVDHELFDDDPAWSIPAVGALKEMARGQLGTVGSGNHYVDIFLDTKNRVWIGVHFGSRGLGHRIATYFLEQAGATDQMDAPPCVLDVDSPIGSDYLCAMALAGRYAYAGRDWVCSEVARILGGKILDEVHNHHNFAWREIHNGRKLWVVRKGATPAFPGQRGFIGSSMGEPSYIIQGLGNSDSLSSTVHGAGRVMSRTKARGKQKRRKVWQCGNYRSCSVQLPIKTQGENGANPKCPSCGSKTHKRETLEQISAGVVSKEMMQGWVQGIELRGAGLDESPDCYKRLPEVLAHHEGSIEIMETLKPIGVAMAGADEFDPYKD